MSQLLKRLRSTLSRTTELNQRIELLALIASNLARQGHFDSAWLTVKQARESLGGSQGSISTVWIMLAEGLIHFFQAQSPQAMDRIAGTQTLGIAMRYPKLIALASAWKAHIQFEKSDFVAMVQSLDLALQNAENDDHDTQTRLAIVLCNAFSICGEFHQAQQWFLRAHGHAIKNGDQLSVDALVYNKVALALARLRVNNSIDGANLRDLHRIRTELSSSTNLSSLISSTALPNYPIFIAARLSILEENYEDAIAKLQVIRHQRPFASNNFDQAYVDLELCYCNFRLGRSDLVSTYLAGKQPSDFPNLDIDERIVAIWMLRNMSISDARFGDAQRLNDQFSILCADYTRSRADLLERLRPFLQ